MDITGANESCDDEDFVVEKIVFDNSSDEENEEKGPGKEVANTKETCNLSQNSCAVRETSNATAHRMTSLPEDQISAVSEQYDHVSHPFKGDEPNTTFDSVLNLQHQCLVCGVKFPYHQPELLKEHMLEAHTTVAVLPCNSSGTSRTSPATNRNNAVPVRGIGASNNLTSRLNAMKSPAFTNPPIVQQHTVNILNSGNGNIVIPSTVFQENNLGPSDTSLKLALSQADVRAMQPTIGKNIVLVPVDSQLAHSGLQIVPVSTSHRDTSGMVGHIIGSSKIGALRSEWDHTPCQTRAMDFDQQNDNLRHLQSFANSAPIKLSGNKSLVTLRSAIPLKHSQSPRKKGSSISCTRSVKSGNEVSSPDNVKQSPGSLTAEHRSSKPSKTSRKALVSATSHSGQDLSCEGAEGTSILRQRKVLPFEAGGSVSALYGSDGSLRQNIDIEPGTQSSVCAAFSGAIDNITPYAVEQSEEELQPVAPGHLESQREKPQSNVTNSLQYFCAHCLFTCSKSSVLRKHRRICAKVEKKQITTAKHAKLPSNVQKSNTYYDAGHSSNSGSVLHKNDHKKIITPKLFDNNSSYSLRRLKRQNYLALLGRKVKKEAMASTPKQASTEKIEKKGSQESYHNVKGKTSKGLIVDNELLRCKACKSVCRSPVSLEEHMAHCPKLLMSQLPGVSVVLTSAFAPSNQAQYSSALRQRCRKSSSAATEPKPKSLPIPAVEPLVSLTRKRLQYELETLLNPQQEQLLPQNRFRPAQSSSFADSDRSAPHLLTMTTRNRQTRHDTSNMTLKSYSVSQTAHGLKSPDVSLHCTSRGDKAKLIEMAQHAARSASKRLKSPSPVSTGETKKPRLTAPDMVPKRQIPVKLVDPKDPKCRLTFINATSSTSEYHLQQRTGFENRKSLSLDPHRLVQSRSSVRLLEKVERETVKGVSSKENHTESSVSNGGVQSDPYDPKTIQPLDSLTHPGFDDTGVGNSLEPFDNGCQGVIRNSPSFKRIIENHSIHLANRNSKTQENPLNAVPGDRSLLSESTMNRSLQPVVKIERLSGDAGSFHVDTHRDLQNQNTTVGTLNCSESDLSGQSISKVKNVESSDEKPSPQKDTSSKRRCATDVKSKYANRHSLVNVDDWKRPFKTILTQGSIRPTTDSDIGRQGDSVVKGNSPKKKQYVITLSNFKNVDKSGQSLCILTELEVCKQCKQVFQNKEKLETHMAIHRKTSAKPNGSSENSLPTNKDESNLALLKLPVPISLKLQSPSATRDGISIQRSIQDLTEAQSKKTKQDLIEAQSKKTKQDLIEAQSKKTKQDLTKAQSKKTKQDLIETQSKTDQSPGVNWETNIEHPKLKVSRESPLKLASTEMCDVCKVVFQSKEELTQHINSGHVVRISRKGDNFSNESLGEVMIQPRFFSAINQADRDICVMCKKVFQDKEEFLQHAAFCKAYRVIESKPKPVDENKAEFLCFLCGASYKSSSAFNKHIASHGPRLFKCSKCSYSTFAQYRLNHHEKMVHLHLRSKKVMLCPICGKSVVGTSAYKVHMMYHSGLRPVQCAACPYQCRSKNQLESHMKTHMLHKPYACELCDFRCKHTPSLRRHYLTVHSDRKELKWRCHVCKYIAWCQKALDRHLRIRHRIEACDVDTDSKASTAGPVAQPDEVNLAAEEISKIMEETGTEQTLITVNDFEASDLSGTNLSIAKALVEMCQVENANVEQISSNVIQLQEGTHDLSQGAGDTASIPQATECIVKIEGPADWDGCKEVTVVTIQGNHFQ
ncbi:Zinc finger protein zfat [Plakobranchus ocellatus]|uniref:Zinc finger protein zfat n=1 Tax=Plakobranchus ocellatus TaxID=259542 RepID=A0AAV4AXH8_9GAST|nr:Zinc finger protein zfat [Plakobranchus ocellatus]